MEAPAAEDASASSKPSTPPGVVQLGRLIERVDDDWFVDIRGVRRAVAVDGAVDPALLDEALEHETRVLLEGWPDPVIVGVVATRRSVTIDREGRIDARVTSATVQASEHVTVKVPGAFARAKDRGLELYGERVVTRARDLAKILAAMIKLN